MILFLYRLILLFLAPFLPFYLERRVKKGKEDPARLQERYGFSSVPRPQGKLVWIHTASVGEAQSVLILIDKILAEDQTAHVLVTSGTVTSAGMLARSLPARAFHQYVPLDHMRWVQRFLKHWYPDLALWVESEIWPNLIQETARSGVDLLLLNARLSEKSFRFWGRFPRTAHKIFSSFSLCFGQDDWQKEAFESLGVQRALSVPSLKWAAKALSYDDDSLKKLWSMVGSRPLWLAASTHEGEEKIALKAHDILKKAYPDLLTVLVPRHPHRGEEILSLTSKMNVARRIYDEPITAETDVYLCETMGEMGLFFKLCPIVLIAGSFFRYGGHNVIEAGHFDCAILHGQDMSNNVSIIQSFHQAGAAIEVLDAKDLADQMKELLKNPSERLLIAAVAQALVKKNADVIDLVMSEINPLLGK
ncbi:MAG: 3-deoxy-D-manno-octulosonic acid transferase [Alphaproteobacteria bacterium]